MKVRAAFFLHFAVRKVCDPQKIEKRRTGWPVRRFLCGFSMRSFPLILFFKNRQTLFPGRTPPKVSPICAESADPVSYRLRRAVKSRLCLLFTEARHEIRALRALAACSLYARLIKPDAPRAMDALNALFRLSYHFARRKRLRSVVKLL